MTQPTVTQYEFSYTTVADGLPTTFAVGGGVADDVIRGIAAGLATVPTITDVMVAALSTTREEQPVPPA